MSAGRGRSHRPEGLPLNEGGLPPPVLVGVIRGRDDSGLYTLLSAAARLPRANTMVNRLDDSTLAAQLCTVRALIFVPVKWFETDRGELTGSVWVDCVWHASRAVSGSPQGAILGCIHDGRHTGKWVWVPVRGSRSIRTAVGVVSLGRAAARPEWTLDHAALLRTHPLTHL
eukprot:2719812-Rhodomonas_salina.1